MASFMVNDLQWGSTGKGNICYHIAEQHSLRVAVCANTPNAGHTAIVNKRKWVHTVLPTALAVPSVTYGLVGPGAVFSPDALIDEVLQGDLHNKVIVIHPAAVPLLGGDKTNEESYVRIGSTMKGTAAANTRRMARDPEKPTVMGQMSELLIYMRDAIHDTGTQIFSSVSMYNDAIDKGRGSMIIEGAQGFGLSVYHGMYPYVTSRDCSPAQLIMDCAVPVSYMRHLVRVGTLRTLPIRVANRYNKEGEMIGTSGPCWDDQYELDWETDLGMEPELTTVTKLPRRVFTYSKQQIESAVHICRPDLAFVNFAQYVSRDALDYIFAHLNSLSVSVGWSGWGPDSLTDIKRYLNGGA